MASQLFHVTCARLPVWAYRNLSLSLIFPVLPYYLLPVTHPGRHVQTGIGILELYVYRVCSMYGL